MIGNKSGKEPWGEDAIFTIIKGLGDHEYTYKPFQKNLWGHVKIHELSTRFIYFEVDGSMPRIKGTSN